MTTVIELPTLGALYLPVPPLSRDIYYCFAASGPGGAVLTYLAHVCTDHGQRLDRPIWIWQDTALHTLVSRYPLHLEASIGWQSCCGRHGYIREGRWIPANDGGWFPSDDS